MIKALIQDTDVVIENYKAGSLKKYGLDYESLSEINPKLVIARLQVLVKMAQEPKNPVMTLLFKAWAGLCQSRVSVMICRVEALKK